MSSNFETCYVSCGCNKCPHAADWGRNGLICYAVCNSIAVYDPAFAGDSGKVIHTLHGHAERVNCVRWLKNSSNLPENAFLSASADGSSYLWSWDEKLKSYSKEVAFKEHKNIVNIADGLIRNNGKTYIPKETPFIVATSSIDSTVNIWKRTEDNEVKLVDVIDWGSGFCLDIKLTLLPDSNVVLLACAAHDNGIHLFNERTLPNVGENGDHHTFDKLYTLVGHDDWIRALDFTTDSQMNLYLASASQDSFVRVYKISPHSQQSRSGGTQNVEVEMDLEIESKVVGIHVNQTCYEYDITLETNLSGHEGWVYGISWYNSDALNLDEGVITDNLDGSGDRKNQELKLLSSSMDKTLIIWSQNDTGAWIEEARLGEVGGITLGFYGGKFRSDGQAVFGHGYQGSFHMWGFNQESKTWEPRTVVGGHTAEVVDLSWDVKGNYILTVGSDQTTRLHAPWLRDDEKKITWHEMARPQIHGYDMTSVAVLSEYKFATGAEEKVIRAFIAPNNFIDNFKRLSRSNFSDEKSEEVPQGASVPALGLSNKPVFEQMKSEGFIVGDEYPDLYFSPIYLTKPPTEENLLQNTLWPEVHKFYGHGYEIYSLAARSDGLILASSCKATAPEHAKIILWKANTWLMVQTLMSHQSTVTQMAFSPDGKFLLSVSRDRRWSLFAVQSDGNKYDLLSMSGKNSIHTRVIWCCAWTYNSKTFATGSRNGKVGLWSKIEPNEKEWDKNVTLMTSIELPGSVTAIAFAPVRHRNFHILSVGLENGEIRLYRYAKGIAESLEVVFDRFVGHQLTVKRLAFRPKIGRTGSDSNENIIQMASCGSDHILKVYDIFLDLL